MQGWVTRSSLVRRATEATLAAAGRRYLARLDRFAPHAARDASCLALYTRLWQRASVSITIFAASVQSTIIAAWCLCTAVPSCGEIIGSQRIPSWRERPGRIRRPPCKLLIVLLWPPPSLWPPMSVPVPACWPAFAPSRGRRAIQSYRAGCFERMSARPHSSLHRLQRRDRGRALRLSARNRLNWSGRALIVAAGKNQTGARQTLRARRLAAVVGCFVHAASLGWSGVLAARR